MSCEPPHGSDPLRSRSARICVVSRSRRRTSRAIRQRLGGRDQVRPEGGRRPLAHEVDDAAKFEDGEAMLIRGR